MYPKQLKTIRATFLFCSALFICTIINAKEIPNSIIDAKSNWVETCNQWDDWDKPGPAFRIFGNSYYVGTCGISAILITDIDGHILIDGGTVAGADIIANNITSLGFSIDDVKLLLHSHEHFDHVAGLARLQELSGAKLYSSIKAAPVISSGLIAKTDPQAGLHKPFPPSKVDRIIMDGEVINIGNNSLTAIYTPGHTEGAISWQWQSCENEQCHFIVYADSLSPISNDNFYFSTQSEYLKSYQKSLIKLSELDCHILIAPHPSANKLHQRLSSSQGLIDKAGCINYSKKITHRLNQRLMKEKRKQFNDKNKND